MPSGRGPGSDAGASRRPSIPTPQRKTPSAPVPVGGVPRLQLTSPGKHLPNGSLQHPTPTDFRVS